MTTYYQFNEYNEDIALADNSEAIRIWDEIILNLGFQNCIKWLIFWN